MTHAHTAVLRRLAASAGVAASLGLAGCAEGPLATRIPIDRPSFPTGLALHPSAPRLAVVSSNSDLGYTEGALLLADLELVDRAIADAATLPIVVTDAYVEGVRIASFGHDPVFSPAGDALFLATREENQLLEIDLDPAAAPAFVCEGAGSGPEAPDAEPCSPRSRSAAVPGNDPFEVTLSQVRDDVVEGLVTSLSSPQIIAFRYERSARRLTTEVALTLGDWLDGGSDQVIGIPSALLHTPAGENVARGYALVQRRTDANRRGQAVDLVVFPLDAEGITAPRVWPLSDVSGASDARQLALDPAGNALLVVLRDPDGIGRISLPDETRGEDFQLAALSPACDQPFAIATTTVPLAKGARADRALVTCYGDDTLLALETTTLAVTDAQRFFGAGPYDIALDSTHVPPRAYVSYFLDDSVGVFDLAENDVPGLYARARIGTPKTLSTRGTR